jgi:hypothetical protein
MGNPRFPGMLRAIKDEVFDRLADGHSVESIKKWAEEEKNSPTRPEDWLYFSLPSTKKEIEKVRQRKMSELPIFNQYIQMKIANEIALAESTTEATKLTAIRLANALKRQDEVDDQDWLANKLAEGGDEAS